MSLRVLLADESSSIKKAFELALQDYQVKVQTVHQGVDVKEIHESFQPDICFMDIMLPKLNGYDACKALKEDYDTPVVLMWSGFMELDSEKFQSSGAESSIEKPFETKTLRDIVQKLVASLNQNEISNHLIFEDDDDEVTDPSISTDLTSEVEAPPSKSATDSPDLPSLDDSLLDEEESDEKTHPNFKVPDDLNRELNVSGEGNNTTTSELPEIDTSFLDDLDNMDLDSDSDSSDDWSNESLGMAPEGLDDVDSFSVTSLDDKDEDDLPFESVEGPEGLDLPPVPAPDFGLKKSQNANDGDNGDSSIDKDSETNQLPPLEGSSDVEASKTASKPLKSDGDIVITNNAEIPQLSKDELKRLILAQSKDIIESVVWDVVPELAKEMIQKEINRLTGEVQIESDLR